MILFSVLIHTKEKRGVSPLPVPRVKAFALPLLRIIQHSQPTFEYVCIEFAHLPKCMDTFRAAQTVDTFDVTSVAIIF